MTAKGARLKDVAYAHAEIMPLVAKLLGPETMPFRKILAPFLLEFWQDAFEQQRFRFARPALVEQELRSAEGLPLYEKIRRIVKIIADGLNVKISRRASDWIRSGVLPTAAGQ